MRLEWLQHGQWLLWSRPPKALEASSTHALPLVVLKATGRAGKRRKRRGTRKRKEKKKRIVGEGWIPHCPLLPSSRCSCLGVEMRVCLAGQAPHPRHLAVSLGMTLTLQLAARSAGTTATEAQGSGGLACGGYPRLPERLEVPQSCPALCDPIDYSPPDSSVHGILQARILKRLSCGPVRLLLFFFVLTHSLYLNKLILSGKCLILRRKLLLCPNRK